MSDLGEEIVKQYIARVQGDKKLREIARTIRNGGGYADAEQYAVRAGEVLSEVFRENITADNFPVGSVNDIYQLIAPSIKMNYEANSQAVALVQKHLNTEGGIGMNPIPTQYDDNATMNIVGRMAKYESYEDAEFMLDQPMVTNSLGTVDKALRENADFQYKSGLKPKIVRTCEADACEWCQDLEGEYDYDEVKDHNNPVFQRHNNCACEITYEPGDGRVQDVVSRDWFDKDAAQERIEYSKRLAYFDKQRISIKTELREAGKYFSGLAKASNHSLDRDIKKDQLLYRNFLQVPKEKGYWSYCSHGIQGQIQLTSNNGQTVNMTAHEFAQALMLNPDYKGGNIWLLVCDAGKGGNESFAKQLADELNVIVKAPTEALFIDDNGRTFISDNDALAEMWYNGIEVKDTGSWIYFKPHENYEDENAGNV